VAATTTDPIQDVIAAGVLLVGWLTYRGNRRAKSNGNKLDEVHGLVNQQLTDAVGRRDVSEAENVKLRADARDAEAPRRRRGSVGP
jgi:hypothetical protein